MCMCMHTICDVKIIRENRLRFTTWSGRLVVSVPNVVGPRHDLSGDISKA